MSIRFFLTLLLFTSFVITTGCDSGEDPVVIELPLPRVIAEEDFTVTDSGLKYYDIAIGDTTFAIATNGQDVVVHYNGWLDDGTMFDSSIFFAGQPFVFTLGAGQVIEGWDEGVLGMYPGGERQLVIPPALAYDSLGTANIPPNATLTFEVTYLGFLQAN